MNGIDAIQAAIGGGRPADALALCRQTLADRPFDVGALYLTAVARQTTGDAAGAETAGRRAAAVGGEPADAHLIVGMAAAARGDAEAALAAFDRAVALAPDRVLFRMLRSGILVQLRRYDDAYEDQLALMIERRSSAWWPGGPQAPLSSAEGEDALPTSRLKLRHDAEQLRHLQTIGSLPADAAPFVEAFGRVLSELDVSSPGNAPVRLNPDQRRRLAPVYNRVVVLDPGARVAGEAVARGWDRDAVARAFASDRVAVIDGLLTQEALAAMRRFCLDSTIWFDTSHALGERGYIGADGIEGFACPLLFQIAEGLRAALPGVIGDLPLVKFWAFKYDHALQGINAHGDAARVNVNFWLTPDEANLDPETGGLMVWNTHVPRDWGFQAYNNDPAGLMRRIDEIGARPVNVPHRQNRAVLFDSDLIHATAPLNFRPGYTNRRLNVTLLYGNRA